MNELSKHNMKRGLGMLLIVIWAMLTVATCAMVWNFIPTILNSLVALGLFAFNAAAIVQKFRAFSKKA